MLVRAAEMLLLARQADARLRAVLAAGYRDVTARGFEPVTWANVPAKLAMALTELREAEGAAHGSTTTTSDRDRWTREVLDCVLRIGGVLTALVGEDAWCVRQPLHGGGRRVDLQPIEVTLWRLVAPICDAIQAWRAGEASGRARLVYCLEIAVAEGIDIWREATCSPAIDALAAIVEANRVRPVLHGHRETV